jgi:PhnB protein
MTIKTAFVPMLTIASGITDISFYARAFEAIELRVLRNDDNSIHVAELLVDGALLHLHEDKPWAGIVNPLTSDAVSAFIGLMVNDPHTVFEKAVTAGATIVTPMTDYDYGYQQGEIKDPFGHIWIIEKITDPKQVFGDTKYPL